MSTVTHPLRQFRERNKLSQEDLAAHLGVTGMTVYRWEKGEYLPRRKDWPKIAAKTGIAMADFLPFAKQGGA